MHKTNWWGISVWIDGKEDDEDSIIYYKWEKEDLKNILMNPKFGKRIMNALYSIWLPQIIFYHQSSQKMASELEHADHDPNFDSKFLDSKENMDHWNSYRWAPSPGGIVHNSKIHEPIYVAPKEESVVIGSEDLNFDGINSQEQQSEEGDLMKSSQKYWADYAPGWEFN